jgi:tryptophanyl-tRNA synthetase
LFAPRKEVEKRVKEIKTDSLGLNDPKDPKNCLIFNLFESFASPEAISHMKERLEKGVGYGYGHAKSDFADEYERVFSERRKVYDHYVNNTNELKPLLEAGYSRAYSYAQTVTQRARDALGLQSLI